MGGRYQQQRRERVEEPENEDGGIEDHQQAHTRHRRARPRGDARANAPPAAREPRPGEERQRERDRHRAQVVDAAAAPRRRRPGVAPSSPRAPRAASKSTQTRNGTAQERSKASGRPSRSRCLRARATASIVTSRAGNRSDSRRTASRPIRGSPCARPAAPPAAPLRDVWTRVERVERPEHRVAQPFESPCADRRPGAGPTSPEAWTSTEGTPSPFEDALFTAVSGSARCAS